MNAALETAPPGATAASERLDLLLESTGEGLFGIDLAGRCTFVNRAAAQMLGWRTEQVLGCNMHELIHHSHGNGSHRRPPGPPPGASRLVLADAPDIEPGGEAARAASRAGASYCARRLN